jgi:CDP-diacylglycerol--serine O-phosphatidyltransferase
MRAPIHDLHASNMVTYLSLAAGLAAVAASQIPGGRGAACALMAASALADTFDGRFARRFTRTDRQSRVGAETDNLVDAVVFGLVPVVVVSRLAGVPGSAAAAAWWGAAFLYLLAVVVRLGFFSAEADHDRFVGLPTPAAALVWSTALIWPVSPWVAPGVFIACAAAMVGPIRIVRPRGAGLAAFAAWAAGLVVWHLGS